MLDHDLDHRAHGDTERDPVERALDRVLATWKWWQHRPDAACVPAGYSNRACGIAWRPGMSWDDLCDEVDDQVACAVEAAIESLDPVQRHAVQVAVLRVHWRHDPMTYAPVLAAARAALVPLLRARHVVLD